MSADTNLNRSIIAPSSPIVAPHIRSSIGHYAGIAVMLMGMAWAIRWHLGLDQLSWLFVLGAAFIPVLVIREREYRWILDSEGLHWHRPGMRELLYPMSDLEAFWWDRVGDQHQLKMWFPSHGTAHIDVEKYDASAMIAHLTGKPRQSLWDYWLRIIEAGTPVQLSFVRVDRTGLQIQAGNSERLPFSSIVKVDCQVQGQTPLITLEGGKTAASISLPYHWSDVGFVLKLVQKKAGKIDWHPEALKLLDDPIL